MTETRYGPEVIAQVNALYAVVVSKTLINLLIEKGVMSFDDAAALYRTVATTSTGGEIGELVSMLAADETMRWEAAKAAGTAN